MARCALSLPAILLLCALPGRAQVFDVDLAVENRTGAEKVNWPVVLTVWKVFGANLDLRRLDPAGFHVCDAAGNELPHALRRLPPDFSP